MGNTANSVGKGLKGAAAGAVAGSVVPVVGTAAGAVVGGLVGLFSGGPDAQHAEADIGGQSIDARAIWEQISPGNTHSLDEGSGAAQALQEVHAARSRQIDALNKTMDAAWQGGGASAAQAGAHPLAIWLDSSANKLQQSHTYLTNQAESFHTVKGKVQEIAKKPPSAGFLDGLNPFSDKDDEINKYNDQGRTNVAAFAAYYQASAQNAGGMPQYQAWEGNNLSEPGGGGHFGGGGGGSFGGGAGGGRAGDGGGGSFGSGGAGTGSFTRPTTEPPRFDATPPGSPPPGTTPPGGNHPAPDFPGSGPGRFGDGTNSAGYLAPDSAASGFGPVGGGFGPVGSGGFGPGGGSAGSADAGGFAGGFAGAGALSGTGEPGTGGGPRGSGAAGVRAGATGAGGMGGMGHGAGKGGKGAEDEEHTSKYLIAEDPNELFGSDALTAPPVIGE